MPFERPTLSELRTLIAQDIVANLIGSDPLLRFSNLQITGAVQASMANLHYGYLDWIAQQATPFTATDQVVIAGWAALKNIFQEPATQATGTVSFPDPGSAPLPSGTLVVRGDGVEYTTTADGVISSGNITAPAIANADPTGQTGAFGNCAMGTVLTLGTTIAGIQSTGSAATAFTGGADLESLASFRARMLQAFQSTPQIGDLGDYETWALAVAGVTRAWTLPNGYGSGTVVVYFMMDVSEAAHGGFPQGTNGVAAAETRDSAATGDQLAVANYIYNGPTGDGLQPVTALVYAVAPVAAPQNFTINGIAGVPSSVKTAIATAISDVFLREGDPRGGTVLLSDIESAIAAVPGTAGFVITSPGGNIVTTVGYLPTLGTVTYT